MKTIKVYNFKLHQLQFQSSIVWIGLTGSWYLPPLGGWGVIPHEVRGRGRRDPRTAHPMQKYTL